jgi:predicted nucleotide-binding protein (sugar kinase/HSP70/actin superfamily)
MKIGIPRGLFYFYYKDLWINFFDKLNIPYLVSPETNKEIKELGNKYSSDEMCLSLKNYIGHVAYLSRYCDCILVPRIDNYGINDQTCTNFLACFDIINNLFSVKVLDYNVCLTNNETEYKGFKRIGKFFKKRSCDIRRAYLYACIKSKKMFKEEKMINMNKLNLPGKKILLVSHSYNIYDNTIGKPVIDFLEKLGCTVIYSDLFDKELCRKKALEFSPNIYWKYSKESIGSIGLCGDKVDGIIFLSTFPCGLDSLVNELVIRKLDKKCLNLVIDDMDAFAGIETRLESFVDIV